MLALPPLTPALLQDFFGSREPGRALNSEECIAKGCALAAAMILPNFKVRDFAMIDAEEAVPVPQAPVAPAAAPADAANAVMAEYRQQEASMGAQVSSCSPSARCVA